MAAAASSGDESRYDSDGRELGRFFRFTVGSPRSASKITGGIRFNSVLDYVIINYCQ